MDILLPLFPLPNVVLFPGMLLPLHIFEDRYRQMLNDILSGEAQFGMLLCQEYDPTTLQGVPFNVGTVADVLECEILEDGRMNILVVGTQRFRVSNYDETAKPYLQGKVALLDDVREGYITQKLLSETTELFQEAIRLMHKILQKDFTPLELPSDPEEISYCIAENLRGSLVLKQELLEIESTKARLTVERKILQKMVKTLAVRTQIEEAFR